MIIQDFLRDWSLFERMLNDEENRILAEFRDALLPELMSGNTKSSPRPQASRRSGEGRG